MTIQLQTVSESIEALLVERNLRNMAMLKPAIVPGAYLRAARALMPAKRVIIGTGFAVGDTFETDGPLGAFALYQVLEQLGVECHIACAAPLALSIQEDYRVLELTAFSLEAGKAEAQENLRRLQPNAVISVERPGLADDGRYYNMRGEDISPRCAVFDYYLTLADCPTIAVGDGGNEIGMGKIQSEVAKLDITPAATGCDELLIADVSNWGAYGLVAMLQVVTGKRLLGLIQHEEMLAYVSLRGSVDGVTRENTLTEDGLPASAGLALLDALRTTVAVMEEPQ
ncbi:MAG: DUF4392 domain-containing protein [Congregibacter sp.]